MIDDDWLSLIELDAHQYKLQRPIYAVSLRDVLYAAAAVSFSHLVQFQKIEIRTMKTS